MSNKTETINNLVEYMINFEHKDPEFWIDCHNCGRGIDPRKIDQLSIYKIEGNGLVKQNTNHIFLDCNSYLVEAELNSLTAGENVKQIIYFHWKGIAAGKGGHSPLPQNTQSAHPIVHRICQWSEPPAFFHLFSKPLIVFSNTPNKRDTHLFIIRGELDNEQHLYEIANNVNNVRSNASYLLVAKQRKCLYTNKANVGKFKIGEWEAFDLKIVEDDEFLNMLDGKRKNVALTQRVATPRLFYFINLSGDYYLTLIEYSLRKQGVVSLFPFLQSHLYTASQPAIFLLDDKIGNIWLWRGWAPDSTEGLQEFDENYEMAKNVLKAYGEQQRIRIREISAGAEPDEFKYLFPIWDETCLNLIKQ